jgi:hypothetical protein
MVALYAAICSVKEGEVGEIEVMVQENTGDNVFTLTVTVRREAFKIEVVGDD